MNKKFSNIKNFDQFITEGFYPEDFSNLSDEIIEYNKAGFLVEYNDWVIDWNHVLYKHNMVHKIEDRTDYDLEYVNETVIKMLEYVNRNSNSLVSADYRVEFRKSRYKMIISLNMEENILNIGTILSDKMSFSRLKMDKILLFEKISL